MSTLKRFAGQTVIYGFSTIVARLINFVLTPIFVKKFPAPVYGIFSNMYAWAAILNALLAFGMETTFFRYLQKKEGQKQQVYNNTFFIILSIVAVFIAATVLFTKDIAQWLLQGEKIDDTVRYVQYFVFILAADALAVIPFARLRAEARAVRYSFIKIINILTVVGLNLLLIVWLPYTLDQKLLGWEWVATWYRYEWVGYVFIANLVASIVTLVLLLPEILQLRPSFNRRLALDMFVYSFPILIANISFIINENIDKIFIEKLLPPEVGKTDLGIYAACAKLAVFLNIFIQAFRLGAEPFFFNHAKNPNSGKTYALIMDYFIIAMALVTVGLVANIEIVKHFISGGSIEEKLMYWSGLGVVPILLIGYIFLGIYMNLSIWYKLSDQTRYGLYISGVGALLTIVLNLIFIPQYSYVASAWITLLAYFTMMVLSYLLGQKNYPIPYHLRKNSLYILAAVALSWLSFTIFNRNLIAGNSLFIVFMLIVFLLERKQLKQLIVNKT